MRAMVNKSFLTNNGAEKGPLSPFLLKNTKKLLVD